MQKSSDPKALAEFHERFRKNSRASGYGIGNVYQHFPCPFCAAADWMVAEILSVEKTMAQGGTCKACGRSAKALFKRNTAGVSFEFVQTGGADQPDWLEPKMRRV